MDVLENMAHVRQQRGLAPIDPTRIEGFGPDAPPPDPPSFTNPYPPIPKSEEEDWLPPLDDDPKPASPLLALAQRPQPAPEPAPMPQATLLVMDALASYQGQAVELSEPEQASIARIILEAVHRRLKAQLDEVRKAAPRRQKVSRITRSVNAERTEGSVDRSPVVRRSPGRPRGSGKNQKRVSRDGSPGDQHGSPQGDEAAGEAGGGA